VGRQFQLHYGVGRGECYGGCYLQRPLCTQEKERNKKKIREGEGEGEERKTCPFV
jgi:hypothetical protein